MAITTPSADRLDCSKMLASALVCATVALAVVVPARAWPDAAVSPDSTATAQLVSTGAQSPPATLTRIETRRRIVMGYRAGATPMSYRDKMGQTAGYAVALCKSIAESLARTLSQASLEVEWVAVRTGHSDLESGRVDLVCAGDAITLADRAHAAFSIPIFPGGVSALVRADADRAMQDALEERPTPYAPLWRGTPPPTLAQRTYSALLGSDTLAALAGHIRSLRLKASVVPATEYETGIAAVLEGRTDVLFGDREKLLYELQRTAAKESLRVLTRRFTFASLALTLPRNDDDFRLAVDRALTEAYSDPEFGELYTTHFGPPDRDTVEFFRSVGVPASAPIVAPP
jgi:polar amino acid transport system substrate-binding protein